PGARAIHVAQSALLERLPALAGLARGHDHPEPLGRTGHDGSDPHLGRCEHRGRRAASVLRPARTATAESEGKPRERRSELQTTAAHSADPQSRRTPWRGKAPRQGNVEAWSWMTDERSRQPSLPASPAAPATASSPAAPASPPSAPAAPPAPPAS